MTKRVPRRRISEFRIPDKAKDELQIVSKITGLLAEKPELLREIGEKMQEISSEYELRMKREVTNFIASTADITPERMRDLYPQIIPHILQYWDRVICPPIWWVDWWFPYQREDLRTRLPRG